MLPEALFPDHNTYMAYLRDWFAGLALACVYRRFLPDSDPSLDDLALQAYAIADAMLVERSK